MVLKTTVGNTTVGSNPTPVAMRLRVSINAELATLYRQLNKKEPQAFRTERRHQQYLSRQCAIDASPLSLLDLLVNGEFLLLKLGTVISIHKVENPTITVPLFSDTTEWLRNDRQTWISLHALLSPPLRKK